MNKFTDKELLDYIRVSPNPRWKLCFQAWCRCDGGLDIRQSIAWAMENYPNAGFDPVPTAADRVDGILL